MTAAEAIAAEPASIATLNAPRKSVLTIVIWIVSHPEPDQSQTNA
jgi:hypothetical protein